MDFDTKSLMELKDHIQQKKYEYSDLNDGTGVIVSIETGKIVTLNGLGNLVISDLVNGSDDSEAKSVVERIANTESIKHGVPVDTVVKDIDSFLTNLNESISEH